MRRSESAWFAAATMRALPRETLNIFQSWGWELRTHCKRSVLPSVHKDLLFSPGPITHMINAYVRRIT